MEYSDVISNLNAFAEAVEKLGGKVLANRVEGPATPSEIASLEDRLNLDLPASLKAVLLKFSKEIEYGWSLPAGYKLEGELSEVFSGQRHWSPDWIVQFNEAKNGWRDEVFPNQDDPYDLVWHNKLAIEEVGNGDYLAIDLSQGDHEPVIYLSHDDSEGHGVEMAQSFEDFVFKTSRLGCVGAEDWQWLPFIGHEGGSINPDCENAITFRKAMGLEL